MDKVRILKIIIQKCREVYVYKLLVTIVIASTQQK